MVILVPSNQYNTKKLAKFVQSLASKVHSTCFKVVCEHTCILAILAKMRGKRVNDKVMGKIMHAPLACIYMDLRNVSCLISTSGHHWERDGSRQKLGPLDKLIRCFSSANQNANHKH